MSVATPKGGLSPVKKDKMADPKTYIHIAIGLILMFGGQFLPPIEPITEVGMQVLFIFIGVIYLWSTVESMWSSLLAVIALGMSDYANMTAVFKDAFGNSTVLLVFFSMVFFGAILEAGVAEYISRWFLTRKINTGRPYVFSYIYIFGVYVVSALTNCFTALMISWPIAYTIIKDLGYTAKDRYAKFLVFGTFVSSILGQPAIPFRGTKLMMIEAFNKASGQTIGYSI
jgi:sodium-dependent dicarboxylate transporter 2/3/5